MKTTGWTIWTERKNVAFRRRFLNIFHEVEGMWEDQECDRGIKRTSNGNETGL